MAHNIESPMRHAHSLPVLRIASPSSVLPKITLASFALCYLLCVSHGLLLLSLSVASSPLDAFPAEYISYTSYNTKRELRSWDTFCISRVKLHLPRGPAPWLKPWAFSAVS